MKPKPKPKPAPKPAPTYHAWAAAGYAATLADETVAAYHRQERLEWTGHLLAAIVECEGTPYAVLIPQMRADIANIESQPPGPLPWRFDRAAFKQHFEAYKAKVGVPHVPPPSMASSNE